MTANSRLVSVTLLLLTLRGAAADEELPSLTIPGSRSSAHWVETPGGLRVAVDEGISFRGTTVHLSLTSQLLAVDEESDEVRWCVNTSAYWNRIAIVEAGGPRGVKEYAVELTRVDDEPGRRVLHDLRTGGRIELDDTEKPSGVAVVPRHTTGDDLVVDEPFRRLVTTPAEWAALVEETLGAERVAPLGRVDFARESVWVVAAGRRVNHEGYRVVEAFDDDARLLLRIERSTFQTEGPDGGGEDLDPWFAVVLPRPAAGAAKELVVEQDVQSYIRGPRIWKEVAREPLSARRP